MAGYQLRVLDLFSGLGGWSQAFLDRGHHVVRYDNDPCFSHVPNTTILDVLNLFVGESLGDYEVILASPPCQAFSLGAGGTHITTHADCRCGSLMMKHHEKWYCPCGEPRMVPGTTRLEPCSEFGKLSIQLVKRTLDIIKAVQPKWWWTENPNGGMIHFVPDDIPRVQVTYCQYGEGRMKLTNLWGNWPDTWHPRPRCKNGDPCHEAARRGAKTGTQGIKGAALRALVPYELSMEVCLACEAAV